MKKVALYSCLMVVVCLLAFSLVLKLGVSEATFFDSGFDSGFHPLTPIYVVVAIALVVLGGKVAIAAFLVALFTACAAILMPNIVSSAFLLFIAFIIALSMSTAVAASTVKTTARQPIYRPMVMYGLESLSIFGAMLLTIVIGLWSMFVGGVGISCIIAFWRWCEWRDRRRGQAVAVTM